MKRMMPAVAALVLLTGIIACARKPVGLKTHEPAEIYEAVASFYDFMLRRDLDSFEDLHEMRARFEDQSHWDSFLDTLLPAMWERKFERNRILEWQVLAIDMNEDQTEAWVKIWIKSDDTLPFGKVMTFSHRWYNYRFLWYPAEIKAPKPTIIEKYR